jgi:hypothetical protein
LLKDEIVWQGSIIVRLNLAGSYCFLRAALSGDGGKFPEQQNDSRVN